MSPHPSAEAWPRPYILWPSLALSALTVGSLILAGRESVAAAAIGIGLAFVFFKVIWHEITRRSLAYLGVGTLAYLVAWNRGVPFLYAFSAACYAIVVVAHLLPRWTLRPVQGRIQCPSPLVQGDATELSISLENPGTSSLRMLEVEVPIAGTIQSGGSAQALLMQLKPGATEHLMIATGPLRRGRHTIGPLRVGTGFPLGLASRSFEVPESARDVWVYPRLFPVEFLPVAGEQFQHMGEAISPRTGGGEEFAGVREYRQGDSRRTIHWRASARSSKLIVKEFMRTVATTVTIAVDLGRAADVGLGIHTAAEDAIRIAGSLARYVLEQHHYVQLALCGETLQRVGPIKHIAELERVLQALALARCDGSQSFGSHLAQIAALSGPNSTAVLVYVDANAGQLDGLESLRQNGVLVVPVIVEARSYGVAPKVSDGSPALGARARRVRRGSDLPALFRV